MKNIVMLQKDENGDIYCQEISKKGLKYMEDVEDDLSFWSEGGVILLKELEEILDKEI